MGYFILKDMTDLLKVGDTINAGIISSREIAILTGKEHSHVMRDIRVLLEQGVDTSNFGLSFETRELPNGGHKQLSFFQFFYPYWRYGKTS